LLLYVAREDFCVSIERPHKKDVYVPLDEYRHKDLPQKPSYVIHRHENVATQKRIYRGKALAQILPVYQSDGVDFFSIHIGPPCPLNPGTRSQLCYKERQKQAGRENRSGEWSGEGKISPHQAHACFGSVSFYVFSPLVGSLFTDSEKSPR